MILMRQNSENLIRQGNEIEYLIGNEDILSCIREQAPMVPFSEETIQFLCALSEKVREKNRECNFPDVASFAFWCRNAHLKQLKEEYGYCAEKRVGRGVSFHITPSNMPVLFAFSMVAGLLSGNCVIVRLSQKSPNQEKLLLAVLEEMLNGTFCSFRDRILLCRYGHDVKITDMLSAICDVRVIWGSDHSVEEIRCSMLPPRAVELTFASRSSAAILHAGEVNRTENIELFAHDFYNDTYLNDQNACSSPKIIYWIGMEQEIEAARNRFWDAVKKVLDEKKYQIPPVIAVKKMDHAMEMAAVFDGVRILRNTNQMIRVLVPQLKKEMWNYGVPGGFFIESGGKSIHGIDEMLTDYCQTLCVYGIEIGALEEELTGRGIFGFDRIVPVGHALDFSLTWDGCDMIEAMSRRITIRY